MKKLIVMLLVASFAAFGTIAFAGEMPTKTKSDSTMTKKMTMKHSKKPPKKMAMKGSKSSKKKTWSKSKKMSKKKTESKKDSNTGGSNSY